MRQSTHNQNSGTETPSVLASLRALLPSRALRPDEALRIAELQANELLRHRHVASPGTPNEIVTELPTIVVEYLTDMPVSGASCWNNERRAWVISLNAIEPETRHRFSLLHEYKHIIDHRHRDVVYTSSGNHSADDQAERAADYFAACVLMPKRLIKRAWADGVQRTSDLAELFDVSERAIEVRLSQLGIIENQQRCPPSGSKRPAVVRARKPSSKPRFAGTRHRPSHQEASV